MKYETRLGADGKERRLILLQEKDYRRLKNEFVDREAVITIWLPAAEFRSGDIIVNQRTREECMGLCGRFELLEEIDSKFLTRNGVRNYYQKWTARKYRNMLRRKPLGG